MISLPEALRTGSRMQIQKKNHSVLHCIEKSFTWTLKHLNLKKALFVASTRSTWCCYMQKWRGTHGRIEKQARKQGIITWDSTIKLHTSPFIPELENALKKIDKSIPYAQSWRLRGFNWIALWIKCITRHIAPRSIKNTNTTTSNQPRKNLSKRHG